jgi:MFS family permease
MPYRLNTKKPHLLRLILLISFPSVAAVLISPALPEISSYFVISNGHAQQVITFFLVGYAVGQLIYSPLANRFGRKPAIYAGIGLYLLASIICLVAIYLRFFELLLLARLLMALGAGAGMAITFTIINDFYYPEQARPVISYTVLAYAFMPAIAIALGGFITSHLSWIDCFYAYLIYSIMVLLVSINLPETSLLKDKQPLKIISLANSYWHGFTNQRLVLFSCIYGLMTAFIYIIASGGPFIGVNEIGLTASDYGLVLMIPYCGQFVGALLSGYISKHQSAYQVMLSGYVSVAVGSVMMLLAFSLSWVNTLSLMAPMFFIMLGLPMTYSSATALAMSHYKDIATGSAVMSFITMTIALLGMLIFSLLPSTDPLIMPACFVVILLLATLVFWRGYHRFGQPSSG